MNPVDIIQHKRDGKALSEKEIKFIVNGYVADEVPDYQMSALLMAICLNGMNMDETLQLTEAMIETGDQIYLDEIQGKTADKHSTGGVGDKTTLVVAPMTSACGLKIAKLSGRGLGHTGGTLDKLLSFKGMKYELSADEFTQQVNKIGICIAGQTANLVPADKKMYALRDVTATVQNLSLIASSIMSKKLAIHTDAIVLDVKYGIGALMKTVNEARELAGLLVKIGEGFNRKTTALITSMEQPLGFAIGNILEVKEAIQCLQNQGPDDLLDLSVGLGSEMLLNSGAFQDEVSTRDALRKVVTNGEALSKLREMVIMQGGSTSLFDNVQPNPSARHIEKIQAEQDAFIRSIDALDIGNASMLVGAGRSRKEDKPDLTAGVVLKKKIGTQVKKGEVIAELHHNGTSNAAKACHLISRAFQFGKEKIDQPLIAGKVDINGFTPN